MSRFVDIGTEERRAKTEDIRNGKSAPKHNQEEYFNKHIIIYLILTYLFSEFKLHILFHILFFIPSCRLLDKRTNSLRLLVNTRSVRLITHLRFLASLSQALLSLHQELQSVQNPTQEYDFSDNQWCR